MGKQKIWKYNKVTGYWVLVKTIDIAYDAPKWLEIFQSDEPDESFILAYSKPRMYPVR